MQRFPNIPYKARPDSKVASIGKASDVSNAASADSAPKRASLRVPPKPPPCPDKLPEPWWPPTPPPPKRPPVRERGSGREV